MENLLLQKVAALNSSLKGELCVKVISRNRYVFYTKSDGLYITNPMNLESCLLYLKGMTTFQKLKEKESVTLFTQP